MVHIRLKSPFVYRDHMKCVFLGLSRLGDIAALDVIKQQRVVSIHEYAFSSLFVHMSEGGQAS